MEAMPAPDISICVAVYRHHQPPNLDSLVQTLPAALDGLSGELIVVLNGISAEPGGLPKNATEVRFAVNQGVPKAWNAAASQATSPVLCVVNDDVLLGPGSLRLMHDALHENRSAGVVGPVGTNWDIRSAQHVSYLDIGGSAQGSFHECDVVSGFLFATRRDLFHELGGFDEAYTPCGFEEVDYCTTVRLRAGLRCFAIAGVIFEHEFGVSASRRWRRVDYDGRRESLRSISRRNRRHFLAKWSDGPETPGGLRDMPG